jgi:hypothetical protein
MSTIAPTDRLGNAKQTVRPLETLVFKMRAELRRSAVYVPNKPFWARKLSLDVLADGDRAQVAAIIDRLRVRRARALPFELAVRFGFRKEAMIAPGGLLVRDRGEEVRYGWKEVQTLRIRRYDRRRRDFESLEIVLPDRVVNAQTMTGWALARSSRPKSPSFRDPTSFATLHSHQVDRLSIRAA